MMACDNKNPSEPSTPNEAVSPTEPTPKRKLPDQSQTPESSPSKKAKPDENKETQSPPSVALPPPMMAYPSGPIISIPHPTQPNLYQMFTPVYYPISPPSYIETAISKPPRILPKPAISSPPSTADQREKARKVSHSAIERRRRERINDKILQLRQLIPSCADQDNLHKMSILQSAIDYMTYLKNKVHELDQSLIEGHVQIKQFAKSMIPKEIEPFTHQFSIRNNLKPIDLLQSAPPSPPDTTHPNLSNQDEFNHMSLQNLLC